MTKCPRNQTWNDAGDPTACEYLPAWQKAEKLAWQIYAATKHFPEEEMEGITAQLRQAALDVSMGIAEAHYRPNHVAAEAGSDFPMRCLSKIRYLLDFAKRLDYLKAPADTLLFDLVRQVEAAIEGRDMPASAPKDESEAHLQTLGKVLVTYLASHEDHYPDSLAELDKQCGQQPYHLDFKWIDQHVQYLGKGRSKSLPPDTPMAYDKTMLAQKQETYVLFNAAYVRHASRDMCVRLGLTDSLEPPVE